MPSIHLKSASAVFVVVSTARIAVFAKPFSFITDAQQKAQAVAKITLHQGRILNPLISVYIVIMCSELYLLSRIF